MLDYIIVGQGIAGTLLSYNLFLDKKEFVVIDEFNPKSSSIIAAGIIDPLTSRRNGKVWMIDELMAEVRTQYEGLEQLLGIKILENKILLKPFADQKEQEDFLKFYKNEDLSVYTNSIEGESTDLFPFGGLRINGWMVQCGTLILAWKKWLKANGKLKDEKFDFSVVAIEDDYVLYNGLKARKIIFCEGYKATTLNPYFKYLPFAPAKGEILDIEFQKEICDGIFYKSVFVMPTGNKNYKLGLTFERDDLSETPTESGKEQILKGFSKSFKSTFTIKNHVAAIRPTVRDRRPFIGQHPLHPELVVFNGLGTKGVSLAPYFSKQLIEHLEVNAPLNPEVDIKRYQYLLKEV